MTGPVPTDFTGMDRVRLVQRVPVRHTGLGDAIRVDH